MSETEQATQEIIKAFAVARAKLGIIMPLPRITFHLRGTTAGKAYIKENRIDLNPVLLHENLQRFLERTPWHEAAHLISFRKYGMDIRPHGVEWSHVMWAFQKPATRCHSYDTSTVTGRRPKSMCQDIT